MVEWWLLGICATLYGAGVIHGMTLAHWTHQRAPKARR